MTDAETKLWHILRAHRFFGAGFRRQTPIGPYIVDFVSHRNRLILEVDGGQHFEAARARRDRWRDHYLQGKGFHVLRFGNLDVLRNHEGVLETIAAAIAERPLPNPPALAGEGAREALRSNISPSPTLPRKRGREHAAAARDAQQPSSEPQK